MSPTDSNILSYGCTSAAGGSSADLWTALHSGRVPASLRWRTDRSSRQLLGEQLQLCWQEAWSGLSTPAQKRLVEKPKLGVILASTKGCVDDLVWDDAPDLSRDTLAPLLDDFLAGSGLRPQRRTCVSNACTSGLSALYLARHWLRYGGLTDVVVISADRAGEFVQKGFAALKVLTPDQTRPFAQTRSGFRLGDAAACFVVSALRDNGSVALAGVSIDAEGHAVTRPSRSGQSLESACRRLPLEKCVPDFIIAHGTSTQINDATEDRVYARLFNPDHSLVAPPLVSATKWCVGHTLGTSSALDLIAGCEALKHQRSFAIATTDQADSQFRNHYAVAGSTRRLNSIRRVMISSLGFGGVHAAALLEKPQ